MDKQEEDKQMEDNPQLDSLEPEEVDNRRAVHMLVEVDIQQKEELAGQCETSAAWGVLPLLVEAQTCHRACPFQPCVVSANNPS